MSGLKKGQCITSADGKRYILCDEVRMKKEVSGNEVILAIYTVKKVWDESNQRYCFLKLALKSITAGVNNLIREKNFNFYYPYIVHIYEDFEALDAEGNKYYCVSSEYIDGMNLEEYWAEQKRRIQKGEMSWNEWETLRFRQILEFLYGMNYYLNLKKIDPFLHRDLKPQNIMIDKEDRVRIVDFDYAHTSGSTDTKRIGGCEWGLGFSGGYTEPRVIEMKKADAKSDIYSAGRVMYYWLNGAHYFNEKERDAWGRGIEPGLAYGFDRKRFKAKRFFNKKYDLLMNIMQKMCDKEENRYENVEEIIIQMKCFLKEYYKHSPEMYMEYIDQEEMPLLRERENRGLEPAPNVVYKMLSSDEGKKGRPLLNYTMRNITVDQKTIMLIYNLNGKIYFIPSIENLVRKRQGDDFEIRSGDEFTFEDKAIRFEF